MHTTLNQKPWICHKFIPNANVSRIKCQKVVVPLTILLLLCAVQLTLCDKPISKDSLPRTEKSVGFGVAENKSPNKRTELRVFKYVSEDEFLKNATKLNSQNSQESLNKKPNSRSHDKKPKKSQANAKGQVYVGKDDPVLISRAQSVTDRSLIPNSFFSSQNQNHIPSNKNHSEQHVKSTHLGDNLGKSGINISHQIHYSTDASFLGTGKKNNATQSLDFNATLSERSRRSPYRPLMHYPNRQMALAAANSFHNQNQLQRQLQRQRQVLRRKVQNPNVQNHQQIMRMRQNPAGNRVNENNRSPLYTRNQNQFQNQFKTPNFPSLIVSIPLQQQQQVRNTQMQNNVRGVAVVLPPPVQKQLGSKNVPGGKLETILPSPSSDFLQYQQYNGQYPINSVEEHSWNHPMYQRYSKAAKNVQSKVSNYISGRPSGRRDSNFRPDFSKMPPIPLPRPKLNPKKRGRPRGSGGPPGPGPTPARYSYPKSAQSIQDILNHFNNDNQNEINDEITGSGMGGSKESGSKYGSGSDPYKRKPPPRDRERTRSPIQGPGAISDLSSELNDVQFSLLRDIRDFAKRPMTLGSPRDEEEAPPIVHLKSPKELHKPYRMDDSSSRDDGDDSPLSPGYNHENGFDEIFNPKPKPVRDMIKKSSRFRQEDYNNRDKDNSRENKEYSHSSRKKDRPNESDVYNSPYYYSKKDRDREKEEKHRYADIEDHDESMDRSDKDDVPHNAQTHEVRVPPYTSSVEIDIERKDKRRNRDRENDRDRDRDRESFERRPLTPLKRRERERDRDRDHPKSIRDKLRDYSSSVEYPSQVMVVPPPPKKNRYRYDSDREYKRPRPIVLKRPYEYDMAPEVVEEKKMQNHEFWNNYGSPAEKNIFGGYSNPSNYNVKPSMPYMMPPPPSPIPPSQPTPTVSVNPYFMNTNVGRPAMNPSQNQIQLPGGGTIIATSGDHHDDTLEIHEQRPTLNPYGQNQDMQNAYLELLHQKMQNEANLMRNQQQLQPRIISSTTKKTPTPMRMKIHIYPNDQAPDNPTIVNNDSPFLIQNTAGNSGYFSGSSPYSSNSVPLLSPRYPQKLAGGYNNNFHLPGPAPSIHNKVVGGMGNNGNANNNGEKSASDKNNKNLVLHLHVHRRNDVGPVELVDHHDADALASNSNHNHFISTDKPINYKEIYEDHREEEAEQPTNPQTTGGVDGGSETNDKSVSMEVPIHDDRIEDVLHTLLQFRDRSASSSSSTTSRRRRRKKRK